MFIFAEWVMIIIGGSSHVQLAKQIAKQVQCRFIAADTKKFADQELRVHIGQDLYEQDVVILQSTSKPANDTLMELMLLADTAKRAGSSKITAIIPYFGYSRQDRPSYTYGPISASLVASIIESSGIDRVITIDLHSKQSEGFFKVGVKNLDPTDTFLSSFKDQGNYVVISPDIGGLVRARMFAEKLSADLAIINKSRNSKGECIMPGIIGNVEGKNCVIVDDIVDTGGTLCTAANLLRDNGAKSVSACITHGVFSGDCIEKIKHAKFDKFYITDTIHHQNLPSFIKVKTVSDLISCALESRLIVS